MDIRRSFGTNVQRLREASGMTQAELGVRVGSDRAYVSKVEAGEQNITLLKLWDFACALGVAPSSLLEGD